MIAILFDAFITLIQITLFVTAIGFIAVLWMRHSDWRIPRHWLCWPWYHFNDLAPGDKDRVEKINVKIE